MPAWQWPLLVPVAVGSLYSLACLLTLAVFRRRMRRRPAAPAGGPAVTLLKPVCGLEKGLEENIRSACRLDWPELQVVLSVQEPEDPALPLLRRVQAELGEARVAVAVGGERSEPNGKIRNLLGALPLARHDVLVISDSDIRLRGDYLGAIVPPLADAGTGCACTFYRAVGAESWWERLEQLTVNADLVPHFVFASVTGAARFVLGASTALTRSTLQAIGGLEALGDYLVEDFEMGKRVLASGRRIVHVPYLVDTVVDLARPRQWWGHQLYWDQNNRAANPGGLFATVILKSVPFALLFAAVRLFDPLGLAVLGATLAWRLGASALFLAGIGTGAQLRDVWLLPLRDAAALVSWLLAFARPIVVWRGAEFVLTGDGRMVPRGPRA
jgi:ceramide glucosyltransferase